MKRRTFLAAATSAAIVPRHVLGGHGYIAPSDTVNVAGIGCGLMGWYDLHSAAGAGARIAALCDVDSENAARAFEAFPEASRYTDYRRLLDQESSIDAVIVATPDHTHAVISLEVMRRGKHVYCEKPLAHTVYEIRRMMQAAEEHGVATQLGNQGHSYRSNQEFCEAVWAGVIGVVTEFHVVENAFNYSRIADLPKLREGHEVPATLDWDLWLGPVPDMPYHPVFHPGAWRGFSPFGSGMIGDFVCHVVDPVFTALDLGAPATVRAEVAGNFDPRKHGLTFPRSARVVYEFPERPNRSGGTHPAVRMIWSDGDTYRAPHPEELPEGAVSIPHLGGDNGGPVGGLVIGTEGKITYASHGASRWRILPEERMSDYMASRTRVENEMGQGMPDNSAHLEDFVHACKGFRQAGSHFGHGGPLTEIGLLGNVALRFPGETLAWDARHLTIVNRPEANQYLHSRYREGWSLG